jgi:murein lipoprotein
MNKKLLMTGAVASIILLSGCSNHDKMMNESMASLTNQVGELSEKVDMMAADHASLKADLATVASEAERANSRIDNIAHSYKK